MEEKRTINKKPRAKKTSKKTVEKNPVGRPKIFKTPEDLYKEYLLYKEKTLNTPLLKQDFVGKDAIEVDRKFTKPLTWRGFEAFMFNKGLLVNIDKYRRNFDNAYEDFVGIIHAIGSDMFDQKFSGAACGIYQQNIIARELGLSDNQEVTNIQRPILEGGKELPKED